MHKIKLLSLLAATAVLSVVIGGSVTANTDDVRPVFNHKTDVSFVIDDDGNQENRDEADFLRFGFRGEQGNGDDVDFCSDQTLDLWFYVHNGTSQLSNNVAGTWASGNDDDPFWNEDNSVLDGPAVAHKTTVRLDVADEASNSHVVTASIKSDESDEVTDSVQIACSDESKQISLVYDESETLVSTRAPAHGTLGGFNLVGNLADDSGAVLGYGENSEGIVPSCFDFASVIRGKLNIVVTEDTEVDEDTGTDSEDPDDTPEGEDTPDETGNGDEDAPEDIPPLGAGAAPLAAVALSSVLGAVGYRTVQSTRR